ncbi:MAG TPA: peroxidase family protein, partial [Gemmatirosa sp.]
VAVARRDVPWVDWSNYFGAGDASSQSGFATRNVRGVLGSLIDLEYQRMELIRYNLFDNSGTFAAYVTGRHGEAGTAEGPTLRTWPEMRLRPDDPDYAAVGGDAPRQVCRGALVRARTLTGVCNDVYNPRMGSTGTLFARNVEFESTFPELGVTEEARNRHAGRLSLLTPDPQVISRRLFTRPQRDSAACADGFGRVGTPQESNCDYSKAPFFNVLAAYWIQFMTHDWFSHMTEGHNTAQYMSVGCASARVRGIETSLTPAAAAQLGCRPGDAMERAFVADSAPPAHFAADGREYLARAPRTFRNTNTAWWDASQLYGFDATSVRRVKRDRADPARLQMVVLPGAATAGERQGYLPLLSPADPQSPEWAGQEAVGQPDNWTVGMSFYHNVFAREHNQFVDTFRRVARQQPDGDSGLRDPERPTRVIRYRDVTDDELYDVARLVVAAEIAKIHTIEWTTQLLYDEPLFRGMNANWNGLLGREDTTSFAARALRTVLDRVVDRLHRSGRTLEADQLYSAFAAGPGIVSLGSRAPGWSVANPDDINGGTNHFGSPFNFPEEFITVYRLHPLVPDLLEYREWAAPNAIRAMVPVVATFRGKATPAMRDRGLANWAVSMGRQRLGALALNNHPRFLQNLRMDRLRTPTQRIDVAALDLIRDREHGVPRFNEFRREYGLRSLTGFDDFVDRRLATDAPARAEQARLVATLREVYGQHRCDSTRVITRAQRNDDGSPITDCLGHPDGSTVDNVEDLDTVVGWLAESTRPHGFAISETQFVVFILNASRRLYSDRFFTSSFRPEFYSTLGLDWVNANGPAPMYEPLADNGHAREPVSPLKRVLLRTMPELAPELAHVVDAFDPWARDRGTYYSLAWKPRPGAEADPAFAGP